MRWNVPRVAPHGPSGAALVAVGGHEMWRAVAHGHLCSPELACAIATLTVINACSGTSLLPRSSTKTARVFKTVSVLQSSLAYELVRFSFSTPVWFASLDALCGVSIIFALCSLLWDAVEFEAEVRAVIVLGALFASTFSLYPLQMGLFPTTWSAALTSYPDQHAAMATYVYAPTCVVVSIVMFGATLYNRALIGSRGLAAMTIAGPMTLIATVLAQDTFFGDTSTQQLVLGVPQTDVTPFVRALTNVHF